MFQVSVAVKLQWECLSDHGAIKNILSYLARLPWPIDHVRTWVELNVFSVTFSWIHGLCELPPPLPCHFVKEVRDG